MCARAATSADVADAASLIPGKGGGAWPDDLIRPSALYADTYWGGITYAYTHVSYLLFTTTTEQG